MPIQFVPIYRQLFVPIYRQIFVTIYRQDTTLYTNYVDIAVLKDVYLTGHICTNMSTDICTHIPIYRQCTT